MQKVGGKGCVLIERLSGCVVEIIRMHTKGARDAEGLTPYVPTVEQTKRLKTMRNLVV